MTKRGELIAYINSLERDDLQRVMRGVLGLTVEEKRRLLGVLDRLTAGRRKFVTGDEFERMETDTEKRTERSENKWLNLHCSACF